MSAELELGENQIIQGVAELINSWIIAQTLSGEDDTYYIEIRSDYNGKPYITLSKVLPRLNKLVLHEEERCLDIFLLYPYFEVIFHERRMGAPYERIHELKKWNYKFELHPTGYPGKRQLRISVQTKEELMEFITQLNEFFQRG